jgi:hypothetical protein
MTEFRMIFVAILLTFIFTALSGYAQELIVFPAKGQSDSQMEKDKYDCYLWAKKETGFDPMAIPTASQPPPKSKKTKASAGRGMVGGALLGAAVGSLTGDAAKGAAIGAGGGAVVGGARKAETEKENQQANQQWAAEQNAEYMQKRGNYNRAFSACLEGKGYTVK